MSMTREVFMAELEADGGKTPFKEFYESRSIPRATAYKWRPQPEPSKPGEPQVVEPFDPDRPEPRAKNVTPKGGRGRSGAITEKTAGQILSMGFFIAASMSSEPIWYLEDDQRDRLAVPFADSCANLPAPIARAVNQYAAPGVFLGELYAVIMEKQKQIQNKGAQPTRVRTGAQQSAQAPPRQPPPTIPTPDPVDVARAAAEVKRNQNGHVADPNLVTTGMMEPDGTLDSQFRG